jgi:hypothetical protein
MTVNDAMRALEEARSSLRDAKHSMTHLQEIGEVSDELRQATSRLMDGVTNVESELARHVSED